MRLMTNSHKFCYIPLIIFFLSQTSFFHTTAFAQSIEHRNVLQDKGTESGKNIKTTALTNSAEKVYSLKEGLNNSVNSELKKKFLNIKFSVKDLPNDVGDTTTISWKLTQKQIALFKNYIFTINRSQSKTVKFEKIGEVSPVIDHFNDIKATNGVTFYYRISLSKNNHDIINSNTIGPVVASPSWFDVDRVNALVFLIVFSSLLLYFIWIARSGKELYIRKVSGLDSVAEAVGRATEMGRKILYIPGIADISEIQTVAGLSILGHIAKTAAEYMTRIIVPNMDPLTYTAAREIVHESYLMVGRPEAFRDEDVFFITSEQFAYTAAVTGYMVREKPAANFFIGWFKAESLMLAETGQSTGAIQIAGTAELDQLPFFVATCDYTLIGEELYAASAYLTRQPLLLGSIKGQDIAKLFLIILLLVGIITSFFNFPIIHDFLTIK